MIIIIRFLVAVGVHIHWLARRPAVSQRFLSLAPSPTLLAHFAARPARRHQS